MTDIQAYIEAHQLAWSPSTVRSETARLNAVQHVLDGNPDTLWKHLEAQGMKPYSRQTLWVRVTALAEWLIASGRAQGPNAYAAFRKANARLFKGAYVRRKPALTFQEAEARLKALGGAEGRRGLEILYSGLRYTESATHANGTVVGKGGRTRHVYVPSVQGPEFRGSYTTFARKLKTIGLKPHDLRKLALSRLVELGANEFELCEIAGWTSLAPALSYIKTDKRRVEGLMKQMRTR